ncbi:hypothetical protein [Oceanirhabdus seepicola]|uniref:Uncharacterized protein n=1 Tax=Oceanirhabdus seepicola TaxID=2828781 RepID=A0A9J6NYY4_9CLOT|nr:hypothetical protein [Oceanirhabdus seepicola]MCM1988829.1 hypothetical protein [Oceanirhabdus seepicola]
MNDKLTIGKDDVNRKYSGIISYLQNKYENKLRTYEEENILIVEYDKENFSLTLFNIIPDSLDNILIREELKVQDSSISGIVLDVILANCILKYLNDKYDNREQLNKLLMCLHKSDLKSIYNIRIKDETNDDVKKNIKYILNKSESIRKELIEKDNIYCDICLDNISEKIDISKSDYDDLIFKQNNVEDYIEENIDRFEKINSNLIDKVLLFGETFKIQYIRNIFSRKYSYIKEKISVIKLYNDIVSIKTNTIQDEKGIKILNINPKVKDKYVFNNVYFVYEDIKAKIIDYGNVYLENNPRVYEFRIKFSLKLSIDVEFIETQKGKYGEEVLKNHIFKLYNPCFYTGDVIQIKIYMDQEGIMKFDIINVENNINVYFEIVQ